MLKELSEELQLVNLNKAKLEIYTTLEKYGCELIAADEFTDILIMNYDKTTRKTKTINATKK